jgi:DNA repair exonuclease SbcCD ATPase subunit
MKKVVFNNLKIKNFLSIGDPGIELSFKSGITLITGENKDKDSRNGVGKSSVIESIYWCLFGSTLRDIKKDKILHNQTKKDCKVILEFFIEEGQSKNHYRVVRSLEPNKILLELDNKDISLSSIPKTDDYIKELIGANEEVFQNAVIMSANNTVPFMAQKKIDKRKFVEGILQLNIFSEMLLKARADFNEIKNENTKLSSKFTEQQRNLEVYNNQIEKNKKTRQFKIEQIQEKIENHKVKIEEISSLDIKVLEEQLQTIKDSITKKEQDLINLQDTIAPKLNEKLKKQEALIQEIVSNIKNLEKSKTDISNKEGVCTLCKRPFEGFDVAELKIHLSDIETELKKIKSNYNEESLKLQTLKNKSLEISKLSVCLNKEIKELNDQKQKLILDSKSLEQLNLRIQELTQEQEDLKNEKDSMEDLLTNTETEIKETEFQLQEVQKQMSILDTVKFVVSEEGVKTFIIKKMLNLLNSKLNYYLQILEAPCTCNFSETFEETITNEKGKECSYFNFSGGERKRIDLAVLFMFQDMLRTQSATSFSISMYDELFDSALDAKGVEKILEILKSRTDNYNECVYIVSHNKEALKVGVDQVLLLEKLNGQTYLIA